MASDDRFTYLLNYIDERFSGSGWDEHKIENEIKELRTRIQQLETRADIQDRKIENALEELDQQKTQISDLWNQIRLILIRLDDIEIRVHAAEEEIERLKDELKGQIEDDVLSMLRWAGIMDLDKEQVKFTALKELMKLVWDDYLVSEQRSSGPLWSVPTSEFDLERLREMGKMVLIRDGEETGDWDGDWVGDYISERSEIGTVLISVPRTSLPWRASSSPIQTGLDVEFQLIENNDELRFEFTVQQGHNSPQTLNIPYISGTMDLEEFHVQQSIIHVVMINNDSTVRWTSMALGLDAEYNELDRRISVTMREPIPVTMTTYNLMTIGEVPISNHIFMSQVFLSDYGLEILSEYWRGTLACSIMEFVTFVSAHRPTLTAIDGGAFSASYLSSAVGELQSRTALAVTSSYSMSSTNTMVRMVRNELAFIYNSGPNIRINGGDSMWLIDSATSRTDLNEPALIYRVFDAAMQETSGVGVARANPMRSFSVSPSFNFLGRNITGLVPVETFTMTRVTGGQSVNVTGYIFEEQVSGNFNVGYDQASTAGRLIMAGEWGRMLQLPSQQSFESAAPIAFFSTTDAPLRSSKSAFVPVKLMIFIHAPQVMPNVETSIQWQGQVTYRGVIYNVGNLTLQFKTINGQEMLGYLGTLGELTRNVGCTTTVETTAFSNWVSPFAPMWDGRTSQSNVSANDVVRNSSWMSATGNNQIGVSARAFCGIECQNASPTERVRGNWPNGGKGIPSDPNPDNRRTMIWARPGQRNMQRVMAFNSNSASNDGYVINISRNAVINLQNLRIISVNQSFIPMDRNERFMASGNPRRRTVPFAVAYDGHTFDGRSVSTTALSDRIVGIFRGWTWEVNGVSTYMAVRVGAIAGLDPNISTALIGDPPNEEVSTWIGFPGAAERIRCDAHLTINPPTSTSIVLSTDSSASINISAQGTEFQLPEGMTGLSSLHSQMSDFASLFAVFLWNDIYQQELLRDIGKRLSAVEGAVGSLVQTMEQVIFQIESLWTSIGELADVVQQLVNPDTDWFSVIFDTLMSTVGAFAPVMRLFGTIAIGAISMGGGIYMMSNGNWMAGGSMLASGMGMVGAGAYQSLRADRGAYNVSFLEKIKRKGTLDGMEVPPNVKLSVEKLLPTNNQITWRSGKRTGIGANFASANFHYGGVDAIRGNALLRSQIRATVNDPGKLLSGRSLNVRTTSVEVVPNIMDDPIAMPRTRVGYMLTEQAIGSVDRAAWQYMTNNGVSFSGGYGIAKSTALRASLPNITYLWDDTSVRGLRDNSVVGAISMYTKSGVMRGPTCSIVMTAIDGVTHSIFGADALPYQDFGDPIYTMEEFFLELGLGNAPDIHRFIEVWWWWPIAVALCQRCVTDLSGLPGDYIETTGIIEALHPTRQVDNKMFYSATVRDLEALYPINWQFLTNRVLGISAESSLPNTTLSLYNGMRGSDYFMDEMFHDWSAINPMTRVGFGRAVEKMRRIARPDP
jgi:uncharacterized coiled-coil protein SlyX